MTDQQPQPPLWRAMLDAPMPEHVTMPEQFATYIRTVAYAIEERFADAANTSTDPIADAVNWLAGEARRAEMGEDSPATSSE